MKGKNMMKEIIKKLERHRQYRMHTDHPTREAIVFYNTDRVGGFTAVMYVPHTENYNDMLKELTPDDVLCDMGAGDLRFSLMASEICKKVYAVELSPIILGEALKIIGYKIPRNLIPVCADWRYFQIPTEVTVVSCLVNTSIVNIPRDEWKENNRRVYHGVINSDEKIPLIRI